MSAPKANGGNASLGRLVHYADGASPAQSRLTEFLFDLATAIGVVTVALIASTCIVAPPIYWLLF